MISWGRVFVGQENWPFPAPQKLSYKYPPTTFTHTVSMSLSCARQHRRFCEANNKVWRDLNGIWLTVVFCYTVNMVSFLVISICVGFLWWFEDITWLLIGCLHTSVAILCVSCWSVDGENASFVGPWWICSKDNCISFIEGNSRLLCRIHCSVCNLSVQTCWSFCRPRCSRYLHVGCFRFGKH